MTQTPKSERPMSLEEVATLLLQFVGGRIDPPAWMVPAAAALRAHLRIDNAEVDQFNDGFACEKAGGTEKDEPTYEPSQDQWLVGFAWARYLRNRRAPRFSEEQTELIEMLIRKQMEDCEADCFDGRDPIPCEAHAHNIKLLRAMLSEPEDAAREPEGGGNG